MSGRCQACDKVMSDRDMRARDGVGEYTTLCGECRCVVREMVQSNSLPAGMSAGDLWRPHWSPELQPTRHFRDLTAL